MAFGAGATPGLAQASQRQNMSVPHGFIAQSVLNQIRLSPNNGNSGPDAQRALYGGGYLPSSNAASKETNEARRPLISTSLNY
jgi:hypothetical protein